MEIKRFGDPKGKKIMLLHGNLMCWRQFEDVIPLLEEYLIQNCDGTLDALYGADGSGNANYAG